MRTEKSLTPLKRVLLEALTESPRTPEELINVANGYPAAIAEDAIRTLAQDGWIMFRPVLPPGYTGGSAAEICGFPWKYQARNMDLTLSHHWGLESCGKWIYGDTLNLSWSPARLLATSEEILRRELDELRGYIWFTLADERAIIALFEKRKLSRSTK